MATAILEITDENFEKEVLKSPIPVLVDFWAEWCGPCRQIAPLVDELAKTYSGKVKVAKVNVDKVSEIVGRYGIMSIPTIMIFHQGEPKETLIGLQSKATLVDMLEQFA